MNWTELFIAEKTIVPNLEAKASDGNAVFTMRQWLERTRQFRKQNNHFNNIERRRQRKPDGPEKNNLSKKTSSEEWGPEALYQITRAEYKAESDSI